MRYTHATFLPFPNSRNKHLQARAFVSLEWSQAPETPETGNVFRANTCTDHQSQGPNTPNTLNTPNTPTPPYEHKACNMFCSTSRPMWCALVFWLLSILARPVLGSWKRAFCALRLCLAEFLFAATHLLYLVGALLSCQYYKTSLLKQIITHHGPA